MDTEYEKWLKIAEEKGWRTPLNKSLPDQSWVHYWQAMDRHQHNANAGRPVAPHRSA